MKLFSDSMLLLINNNYFSLLAIENVGISRIGFINQFISVCFQPRYRCSLSSRFRLWVSEGEYIALEVVDLLGHFDKWMGGGLDRLVVMLGT